MRTRKNIEQDAEESGIPEPYVLETLLDIRDLLKGLVNKK